MAGSHEGGLKTRNTNYERHGLDFYRLIGGKGGRRKVPKGFALDRERARLAGQKGGKISRRTKRESTDN